MSALSPNLPAAPEAEERHEHDEVAWRLRHLKRSVLKEAEASIADLDTDDSTLGDSLSSFGRAVGDSARYASSLFADLPVNGQLNLLTSTSFDRPQDLFSLSGPTPRGLAYISIEAPGTNGDWRMRGTLTQGDLASWIVAGSYVRHQPATHAYEAGVSYSMQRYLGGNGQALTAMRDGSRNVGAMYAMDNWRINPELEVSYGAKYARYDYLEDRGLLSPRVTMILQPDTNDSLKVRTTVMHREVAPGAEEFIPPSVGMWLPPERTFSQVSRASFLPERHDQIEIAVDRQWAEHVIVGFRAFTERVEDQVVTVFGVSVPDAPAEIGHYQVGSAGDFAAHGWGVTFSRTMGENTRATVDYTQAQIAVERAIERFQLARGRCAIGPENGRAHPRRHRFAGKHRRADGNAFARGLQTEHGIRGVEAWRELSECGRALRCSGEPGIAVYEFHERTVGDARGCEQPLQGSALRELGV